MYRIIFCFIALTLFAGTSLAADLTCDLVAAAKVMRKCETCHSLGAGEANKQGPNLYGVLGRQAGQGKNFKYSKAVRTANVIWDEDTLDRFLAEPRKVIPRNRMPFIGLKRPSERSLVICYLKNNH